MGDEPKNSGRFGKGNPGKPKGAVTKTGKLAREAIALAAEQLGGADRLVSWAQEDPLNERAFWATIYPNLLPLQVTGEDGKPIQSESKATLDVSGLTPEQLRAIASIPLN